MYEKHTWTTGETITADKLNNIENGIVSSFGRIGLVNQGDYYDLTVSYNDLLEMLDNGVLPFVVETDGETYTAPCILTALGTNYDGYTAEFNGLMVFKGNSPDVPMTQSGR